MNDSTTPTRIARQLAAAQERFRTVLDALDASVSVAPIGSVELLFANRRYRQWFGETTDGHLALLAQGGAPQTNATDESVDAVDSFVGLPLDDLTHSFAPDHTDIYVQQLGRWVELKSRYLTWVDGRLVQMVIAVDVTARHDAEERAAAQEEHTQAVGRLITMGEMASSVAHELNQPLAAISNYCAGIISRSDSARLDAAELHDVLEKIAHQAQRAGQIVQHIRAFVKRSAPQLQVANPRELMDQVTELAEISLRRRHITFESLVDDDLPDLCIDPVLVEQVLLNLIRNGADSVDSAERPSDRRSVKVCVRARGCGCEPAAIEFRVTDTGAGFAAENANRLYEAFFSTKSDGMGMGLNLCRSIIEAHRGRISATNLYNDGEVVGCRFTFWIPVSARSAPHPGSQAGSYSNSIG
jgi:signal transduction histidine kinase